MDQWHAFKGTEDARAADAAGEDAEGVRGRGRQAHTDVLEDLRKLQGKRHTLEIARDILHDPRVRDYACMTLIGRTGERHFFHPACFSAGRVPNDWMQRP